MSRNGRALAKLIDPTPGPSLVAAAVGGFVGSVTAAATVAWFWPVVPLVAYTGAAVAGYLLGAALARIAWGE